MTVTNTSARNTAAVGNGSTVLFPTGFEFFDSDELLVYKRVTATGVETLQIEGTDYTVTGGAGAEGTVDFTVDTDSFGDPYPPPATEEVHIIRNTDRNQPEDLTPSQVLPSAAIERGMDRSVMRDQDDELRVSKALRAPITDSSGLDMELPNSVDRASKVMGFDSAGAPVATTQADQSALTVVATGSTIARSHAERWGEVANVKDFGATGDGSTDDAAAIQAAIDAAEAGGGGVVYFPASTSAYKISSTLTVTQNVFLDGPGPPGHASTNANSTNTQDTQILWAGTNWDGVNANIPASTMVYFKADGANEYLYGGGCRNLTFVSPGNGAAVGIRTSSTARQRFENLVFFKFGLAGMLCDSANGVLSFHNSFDSIHFIWGSSVGNREAGMNGVFMSGGNLVDGTDNVKMAQYRFGVVHGLLYNGHHLRLKGIDNCVVGQLHGVTQSGGTGKACYFENAASSGGRNNLVLYISGDVHAESQTRGNNLQHWNSEGSVLTADAGAQIHYDTVDYVTAERYKTHAYKMDDWITIPPQSFISQVNATASKAALQWPAWSLPQSSVGAITAVVPAPRDLNEGDITKIEILYRALAADNTLIVRMDILWYTHAMGGLTMSTPVGESQDVTVASTNDNAGNTWAVTLASPISYQRGDTLLLKIRRDSAHVNDTAAAAIDVLGVRIYFKADGPNAGDFPVTGPEI